MKNISIIRFVFLRHQLPITDDKNLLGYPKDFKMTVTGYKINNGAGFVTILMGNVITMPGLSKKANYLNIDVVGDDIIGIF